MSQNEEGASGVEEGVDDRGGYDWGDQAETEYAKRFPGGPGEMFKSINSGTQRISQLSAAEKRAQDLEEQLEEYRAAEEEREQQWQDPLQSLPTGVDEATTARLVAMFQHDPAGAYDMARQATPGYGNVLENQMFTAWLQRDPVSAMRHLVGAEISPVLDERFQSFEDSLSERLGPTLAHSVEQMSSAAVMTSRSMAPDITQYEARIEAALLENPALISDVVGNVQKSAERLVQIRDMLWAQDQRTAGATQAQATPEAAAASREPQQPSRRARQATIGRSDEAAPPVVDQSYAERMSLKTDRSRSRAS